jgi:uncharacterized spore protein YtfJ
MDAEEEARREAEQAAADERLGKLAEAIGGSASAKAVFGEPVERDGVTVIPVARVRYGFGAGSGRGGGRRRGRKGDEGDEEQSGSGGGGGLQASPIGYIELQDGRARFVRVDNRARLLSMVALPLAVLALGVVAAALSRARRPGGD